MEWRHQGVKDTQLNIVMKSFIDLCAGTGAFSIALESTGKYKCVYANDMMKSSQDIYTLNHRDSQFKLGDMMDIDVKDIPAHQLLCSGFPCQPFSIAGDKKGFDDDRSNVFWKIIEILEFHNPETIILENVKNLITHDKGRTFKIIKESLENLGYFLKYKILDTCKITHIPQHRERIYIVGFKNENAYNDFNFNFEEINEPSRLITFIEKEVPEKYYYTNKLKVYEEIEENVKRHINDNVIYQYRRYYVRENKSNCCPTLTANMGGGGHNVPLIKDDKGIRKLTPRECFNLQGFPKEYSFPKISDSALYKLAGNAVSVPVITLVASKLASNQHLMCDMSSPS